MRQTLIQGASDDNDSFKAEQNDSETKSRSSLKSFVRTSIKKAKSVHITKSPYQAIFDKYTDCTICLEPLLHKQRVKILPLCKHIFHEKCCDQWLDYRFKCPNCNSGLIADPAELPQSMQDNLEDEQAWIRELEDEMRQEEAFMVRIDRNVEEN
jgi:hypothetical protein